MASDSLASGWAKVLGVERKQFSLFFDKMLDGFAYHKIVVDTAGKPIDYVFLEVNHAFEKMTGLKRERIIGKKVTEVIPGIEKDSADWIGVYGRVALTEMPVKFENHAESLGKWYKVSAYCPEKGHFVALFEDITERKLAEEAVRQSERRYHGLYEAVAGGIVVQDQNGSIIEANNMACEILGLTRDQMQGRTSTDSRWHAIHEDNSPFPGDQHPAMITLRTGKALQNVIMGVYHPNRGQYRWIIVNSEPIKDAAAESVQAVVTTFVDITKLKQTKEALRESEERWKTTLSSIGDAVIATDTSGKIAFMNAVAEKVTGWTLGEASNKPIKEVFNIVNEQTRLDVENPVAKVLEKGMIVALANHTVLIRKDGVEVPIDDSGAPIKDKNGKTAGVVLVFRDISERRKMEKALSNLARFPSENPYAVFRVSKNGSVLYANPETQRLPTPIKLELGQFVAEQWRKLVMKALASNTRLDFEEEADGLSFMFKIAPVVSEGYVNVYGSDITERKKAQEDLRKSEERLRFHAENTPLAVVEWNSSFVVTRWAGDAEKMFGWTTAETVGKPLMDLNMIYPSDIPLVEKTMGRMTKGEIKVVSSNRNIAKDGKVIYCTWYNSVLLDEKGKMVSVFSFVEDNTTRITAEKALEETNRNLEKLVEERTKQLQDKERLATIGATAGMVGHDIRNPLQAITSDVYLAKTDLAAVPESEEKNSALESLHEIEKNVGYINKIVADLQDFARPLKPRPEETDLKLIIDEFIEKNGLPENVKLSTKVDPEARKIVADSTYINRIMYNLVNNAVQAMPNGGKLTIQVYKEAKDVVIAVKDTGVGIPERIKDKLFTPMFTTKAKGQGFGLAVIKRMTESLGGTVTFESQEGKGTTFIVRFPHKKR